MTVDDWVLRHLADHRSGWATGLSRALMAAGSHRGPLVVELLACLAVVVLLRAWRPAAAATLAALVAVPASEVLKSVVHRPRPPASAALVQVGGWSMPSSDGALTASVAVALGLAALRTATAAGRAVAVVLTAAVLVIGAALVYLGAHWLSDVLAGWALGAVVGTGCHRLLARPRPAGAASRA